MSQVPNPRGGTWVNTKVEVSSEMFSDELKELIAKKENVFEDLAKTEREKELKKIKSKKKPPVKEGKSQPMKKRMVSS